MMSATSVGRWRERRSATTADPVRRPGAGIACSSEGRVSGYAELSDALWHERELLDILVFKLEQERLLLADGAVRWLSRATREIDVVVDQLRAAELARAVEANAVARDLRLGATPTLAAIGAAAPPPWGDLFEAHRAALRTLVEQVGTLARANAAALEMASDVAHETLFAFDSDLSDRR
jgi:hypothetical protein